MSEKKIEYQGVRIISEKNMVNPHAKIIREESFEDKFPSLKKEYNDWTSAESSGFYPDSIEEACTDNQRIKEAIQKLSWDESGKQDLLLNSKDLLKELGLEQ